MNSLREVLSTYDPAAALINDEEIAFFIADALQTGDAAYIAKARDIAARTKSAIETDTNSPL
jgi:DNA-binding phage protein